jgi:hypothetical protein
MANNLETNHGNSQYALDAALAIYEKHGFNALKEPDERARGCGGPNCRNRASEIREWYFGETSIDELNHQEEAAIVMVNTLLPYYKNPVVTEGSSTQKSSDPLNIIFNARDTEEPSVENLITGEETKE